MNGIYHEANRLPVLTLINARRILSPIVHLFKEDTQQTRRDRKKAKMRLHIVQCAMKLFRKQGFDNTTMEGIADTADVAKRTLYSYFPVKEAIVSAHWLHNAEKKSKWVPLLMSLYPSTRSRLMKIFLDGAKGFKAEPEYARIHFSYQFQQISNHTHPGFQTDFDDVLTSVMEAGQMQGDIRRDIASSELATQVRLNFTAISLMWFSDPDSFSLDERLAHAVDCFIDGAGKK